MITSENRTGGFRADSFDELAMLEENNFWFRNRNRLIIWAIREYFPEAKTFLEIGCGTGFVLRGVQKSFPTLRLTGSELFEEGLKHAQARLPDIPLIKLDARDLPFENQFDLVGAFDVLEHIQEDELVLEQMRKSISLSGGGILITVPQHPWLWSAADEEGHVRRYTRRELVHKVERAGFVVKRVTSFVSFLLPLMIISRALNSKKQAEFDPLGELRIGGVLNTSLEQVLRLESMTLKAGVSYPLGGSLLLIAQTR